MKPAIPPAVASALTLAMLLVTGRDSAAQTLEAPLVVAGDTGIVTLGPNQALRATLATRSGGEVISAAFRRFTYNEGACTGGVCTQTVASQSTSPMTTLGPGQGASFEVNDSAAGVRLQVLSSAPRVRVLIEIVDVTSNGIIAILIG
jgi:hypothetical protein